MGAVLLAAIAVAGTLWTTGFLSKAQGPRAGHAKSGEIATDQGIPQSPLLAPTGPYSVGRTEFDWVDTSRPDPDSPNGHRELAVWIWYPASAKHGAEPAEWMPGKWGELFWSKFVAAEVPGIAAKENLIGRIHAHSITDAPLSSEKRTYPVLLFEPGFTQVPLAYSALTEDAASHGYIVVAIVPTHYTTFTVLAGGRVPGNEEGFFASPGAPPEREGRTLRLLRIWSGDMTFALDQLQKLNSQAKSPLGGRLDFARVGAFGHSFGGFASLEVLKEDSRVRAAIDLDGRVWGLAGSVSDIHKPLLIFEHHSVEEHPTEHQLERIEYDEVMRNGNPGYRLTLDHSVHASFSDLIVLHRGLSLPSEATQPGLIDPARALAITRAYVEAFFGHYLMGEKSPLLDGPSPEYSEVEFETSQGVEHGPNSHPPAGVRGTAQPTAPGDVTGTWTWTPGATTPEIIFDLKEEGGKVTGRVIGGPHAGPRQEEGQPIAEGKVEGDRLTLKVNFQNRRGNTITFVYAGKVNGNHIEGTIATPKGTGPFSVSRK
jgi:dienelactone hydrolase